MSFAWPWALLAPAAVPLLLVLRWWLNRRRRRAAITVSSVALIRAAVPGRTAWQRRIPVYLFLIGLLALGGGLARPQARVAVPADNTSILLAIDVSSSMCSTDVAPNRLAAATEAATAFIDEQHDGTRIGLVAFSGIAGLLVPPTTDKKKLLDAIANLKTVRGTAIGQAILTALDAIAEMNPDVPGTGVDLGPPAPAAPGEPPTYQPDTIVVLTDGSNTTGVDPVTAAGQAAARRVRVFTIGFGTTDPSPMMCTADQLGDGSAYGGRAPGGSSGGRGGGRAALEIDEQALNQVADLTGGRYFRAQDAGQLNDALGDLPREIGLHRQTVEVSVWFLLAGTLLVFSGVGLSLGWDRAGGNVRGPAAGAGTVPGVTPPPRRSS